MRGTAHGQRSLRSVAVECFCQEFLSRSCKEEKKNTEFWVKIAAATCKQRNLTPGRGSAWCDFLLGCPPSIPPLLRHHHQPTNPLQLRLVPLYGATSSEMRVQDQNGRLSGSSHTQFTLPGVRRARRRGRRGWGVFLCVAFQNICDSLSSFHFLFHL